MGANVGFDLWDEQTVRRLIVEQSDLMPYYPPKRAVNRGIDLTYGKRQITAQVTTGILQGESIKHLADRLQQKIPDMNRASAIRAARTAVTSAQNAGRLDSYIRAEEMGIVLQKRWLATLDSRTRHYHADADGQAVKTDSTFIVGGEEFQTAALRALEKCGLTAEAYAKMLCPVDTHYIEKGLVKVKIYSSSGTTQEMADIMNDNAAGAMAMLSSAINVLFTNLSQFLIPAFTDIVREITDVVNWFNNLNEGTQKLILTIAGIAAAVGPVLIVIGKIVTAVGTIGSAIGGLTGVLQNVGSAVSGLFSILAANPIAAVIAAVAALAVGLIVLWNTNEDFRNAVGEIWEAITGFFTAAVDTIKAAWEGIAEFFSGIWQSISGAFQGVAEFFGGVFGTAADAVQSAWQAVAEYFSGIADGIRSAFETVTQFLGNTFRAAWEAVQSAWSAAVGFFTDIWNGIQEVFSAVTEVLGGSFQAAWEAVQAAWSTAKEFFSNIWQSIKESAQKAADEIGSALKKAWDTVKSAWDGAKNFFSGIWSDIKGVFSGAFEHFKSIGSDIVNGIKNGISSAWKNLTKATDRSSNYGALPLVPLCIGPHRANGIYLYPANFGLPRANGITTETQPEVTISGRSFLLTNSGTSVGSGYINMGMIETT